MIKNKKGVSEILSYVILIGIVVAMSVGVFAWMKTVSNITPAVDCEEDTSLFIENYECKDNSLTISVKNNGRFNIDGFMLTVSDNVDRAPIYSLIPSDKDFAEGTFTFSSVLKPGESADALFTNQVQTGGQLLSLKMIASIQIQPFIFHETAGTVVCKNALIKQNLKDCEFNK